MFLAQEQRFLLPKLRRGDIVSIDNLGFVRWRASLCDRDRVGIDHDSRSSRNHFDGPPWLPSLFSGGLLTHLGSVAGWGCGLDGLRGGPIKAGWNSTAAVIVHRRASAISLPMLDIPGFGESHKLPNAIAVVMALKITALVRLDCTNIVLPVLQAMT